jgi:carbon storage regulator
MLVLTRKKNESIAIGDDITLTVVEVRPDRVRLRVDAPKDIPVHRQEVYEAIHRRFRLLPEDGDWEETSQLRADEPIFIELPLD